MSTSVRYILFGICFSLLGGWTIANSPDDDFIAKGVSTIEQEKVDTEYPTWLQPDSTESITNFDHWMGILPFSEDRYVYDVYVVIPQYGLVVPLIDPFDWNLSQLEGKSVSDIFDHDMYNEVLEIGAFHHPGTYLPTQGPGNLTFALHSSYRKNQYGKYKTVGQVLVRMDVGDKIWVYIRDIDNYYRLYSYTVVESYRTHSSDVSIGMYHDKYELTAYACVDFGTAKDRWVIHADQDFSDGWFLSSGGRSFVDNTLEQLYRTREDALSFFAEVIGKAYHILDSFDDMVNPSDKRLYTVVISYLIMRMQSYTY